MEVGPAARKVFMFYNRDYANAKGFELSLSKPYSDNISFEANYTYSTTKGRSESPFEESYSVWSGSALLPSETRMPWDQNHTLNCLLTYYISEDNKISFLNSSIFRNLGITFKYNYGSGFPYTPTGKNLKYSKNSVDMPYTSQLDMRIEKKISLFEDLSLNLFIDCINLFNRKNVKEINPLTGKPYTYGDLYDNTNNRILTYREILSKLDESGFYGMRQILAGVKIEF
jgi:outer membrane receptor protein involved in Fe transport